MTGVVFHIKKSSNYGGLLEGNAKQDLPDMASYPNCMHFRLILVEQPAENSFKESALNASKMAQYELIHIICSVMYSNIMAMLERLKKLFERLI